MDNEKIYSIAVSFRQAILEAKNRRKFDSTDRMSRFPSGCCDDVSDLLGYYLMSEYEIFTIQMNGIYRDDNPYNITNHAWLVKNNDDIIIDITVDQFNYYFRNYAGVYVGKSIDFYESLDRIKIYDNFDISKNDRLLSDYKIILEYI